MSYNKNAGETGFFKDNAPPEIKALADNLLNRTNLLWDSALQYANSPEFVYEVRQAWSFLQVTNCSNADSRPET